MHFQKIVKHFMSSIFLDNNERNFISQHDKEKINNNRAILVQIRRSHYCLLAFKEAIAKLEQQNGNMKKIGTIIMRD